MDSSIFQARSGILLDLVEVDEGNGACSECLSIVIPERSPSAMGETLGLDVQVLPDCYLVRRVYWQAGEPDGTQSDLSEPE